MVIMQFVIQISYLTVSYSGRPVLWLVDGQVPAGALAAIVGPNGAGKTTLIKSMVGLVSPDAGVVKLFGTSYEKSRQRIAYVPQKMSVDWDFPATVFDIVLMGRFGLIGWFKRPSVFDYDKVYQALDQVNMRAYADHHIGQLSGGQQQRVFIARALVQDADLYLMDEPFTGVDIVTEQETVRLMKQLCKSGKTVVVIHHDLQTLRTYFDWLWFINGRTIACGPTDDVLTKQTLSATYGMLSIPNTYI